MRANSSERGFTLAELIAVMVVIGVLAAVALPKFEAGLSLRNDGWHDEMVSGLRYAHAIALSHRRLVCATVDSGDLVLAIAPGNPAAACSTTLPGPDGAPVYTSNSIGIVAAVSPAGVLYFQPDGKVTSDASGATVSSRSITISGSDTITVVGETGNAQ